MAPTSLKAGLLLLAQLQLTWAMILGPRRPTSASGPTTASLASGMPQQTGTSTQCNNFYLVEPDEQCDIIEARFGLSRDQFITLNPTVDKACTTLIAGYLYCVGSPGFDKFSTSSIPTSAQATPTSGITTSTTPAQATPTSSMPSSAQTTPTTSAQAAPTNSVAPSAISVNTPQPIQTGMVTGCNKYHFVESGNSCFDIAKENNVPLATFYSWNPAVGPSCATLNVGYYVCVDAAGSTPPAAAPTGTTASSAGNGMPTPTPFQPGMVPDCKKFYLVKSGDTCAFIAEDQGTTVDDIKKWNPQVGSGCTALWLNNNICVGV
ncbi:uncharacterized protein TRIVIDRAFT_66683 [Trichoderma virens Gv29-8]|uniref:LysM domain-containing protein n=1 Tax=Hypocrea virens (strain Gv29-8 / FGSC 10586) TaxID=413071 RepID=G9N6M9_HYPVG|nr:uncharacterized protein TRIVIDRAFT_66683 [Trichoderma virens Gv29-8]EHK17788.1 hypothetical protein TRIVIDRAFT_66683 [Trichoderma virens Gv29-8]